MNIHFIQAAVFVCRSFFFPPFSILFLSLNILPRHFSIQHWLAPCKNRKKKEGKRAFLRFLQFQEGRSLFCIWLSNNFWPIRFAAGASAPFSSPGVIYDRFIISIPKFSFLSTFSRRTTRILRLFFVCGGRLIDQTVSFCSVASFFCPHLFFLPSSNFLRAEPRCIFPFFRLKTRRYPISHII